MCSTEGVVFAFATSRKAGNAAPMAQSAHRLATAGQYLVAVGLMTDVPDDAIFRRVKDVVQRDRQFDRAQIRRQMPAGLRDGLDQEGAKLIGDDCQFAAIQGAQVGR
ncbi:hypothetical protein SDC9_190590 [bioreactor metagenome]|uniref:Uncharacterized protein n=1 Tax=bioreactor metagenome TaxID=1076179 RepID=A0A645HVE4_9ZZZZ